MPSSPATPPSAATAWRACERPGGRWFSGAPLTQQRADAVLAQVVKATNGRVPVIGVGGISVGGRRRAQSSISASLIQIYTGMLYRGPGFVGDLVAGLASRA